jgi:hypothetical protein
MTVPIGLFVVAIGSSAVQSHTNRKLRSGHNKDKETSTWALKTSTSFTAPRHGM